MLQVLLARRHRALSGCWRTVGSEERGPVLGGSLIRRMLSVTPASTALSRKERTMGRRGNGEGTITRRKDGRWEARYYVPTMNGTKRKTIYGKTQAEVRDKLTKALSDRIDGIVYDDENMTVGEYLDAWLKGSVYGSVRRSTYDRDTNLVNNHIKAVLGRLKLKKLNSAHVQAFYRNRLDEGLSASTVHKMHDIL